MERNLEIIGLENFNEGEHEAIKNHIENLHKKFLTHTRVGNISKVKVFLKNYPKQSQTSVKIDAVLEQRKFEADGTDRVITVALKKAFQRVSEEMEHSFHNIGMEKH